MEDILVKDWTLFENKNPPCSIVVSSSPRLELQMMEPIARYVNLGLFYMYRKTIRAVNYCGTLEGLRNSVWMGTGF